MIRFIVRVSDLLDIPVQTPDQSILWAKKAQELGMSAVLVTESDQNQSEVAIWSGADWNYNKPLFHHPV